MLENCAPIWWVSRGNDLPWLHWTFNGRFGIAESFRSVLFCKAHNYPYADREYLLLSCRRRLSGNAALKPILLADTLDIAVTTVHKTGDNYNGTETDEQQVEHELSNHPKEP